MEEPHGILKSFADGTDWANGLVKEHLALTTWPVQDVTAQKLYKGLFREGEEPSVDYVTELFVSNRLLLWNFLPHNE